jgi:hypothetical protein
MAHPDVVELTVCRFLKKISLGHDTHWDKAKILALRSNCWERMMKGGIEIRFYSYLGNRKLLSTTW